MNGDVSRLLTIQKPKPLPEAYTSCLEFQNLNFRNSSIHPRYSNTLTSPTNQMNDPKFYGKPQIPHRILNASEKSLIYNTPAQQYQ